MKKMIIGFILIMSFVLSQQVFAQDNLKFGYVDIQKVIFSSNKGKTAIAVVKKFQQRRQREISDLEDEVNKLEKDLSKQLFSITEEAKAIKDEDIRSKKLKLKRLLQDSEYELSKRKKDALNKVNKKVVFLIQKLGKEQHYSLILELTGSNIIYAGNSFDLTQKIIDELDKTK